MLSLKCDLLDVFVHLRSWTYEVEIAKNRSETIRVIFAGVLRFHCQQRGAVHVRRHAIEHTKVDRLYVQQDIILSFGHAALALFHSQFQERDSVQSTILDGGQ